VLVPTSGDAVTIFTTPAGGRRKKLYGTTPNNNLMIAETTRNLIDLNALMRDSPELRQLLTLITDEGAFLQLFHSTGTGEDTRRPISRGMAKHRNRLRELDVLEDCGSDETGYYMKLFLVEKKNGEGRIIGDARPLNEAQIEPPPMMLPDLHKLIAEILTAKHVALCDGKSFFYQFLFAPEIRKYFRVRLGETRGDVFHMRLVRLCMGWKFSPCIAQRVANFLTRHLGHAWVDNFIITARNEEEFAKNTAEFRSRLKEYNVAVDDESLSAQTRFTTLGIEFDLSTSSYRLAAEWLARKTTQVRELATATSCSVRDFLRSAGAIIWYHHVTCLPLWMHAEVLGTLQRVCSKGLRDLDETVTLPQSTRDDLLRWAHTTAANDWRQPRPPNSPQEFIITDASSTGGAWMSIVNERFLRGDMWHRDDHEIIFLAELDALIRARPTTDDPLFVNDNAAVTATIAKGHSGSYTANIRCRQRFGPERPRISQISTNIMAADRHSRGSPLPRAGSASLPYIETSCTAALSNFRDLRPRTVIVSRTEAIANQHDSPCTE
jgi:hypothetical protein